jgi:putative ABC transport system permease protein
MKLFLLILKNLRRNLLRTTLTSVAIMVLVLVVTLVWTVLWFLDQVTAEKSKDFKAIVTERWQLPSQMPFAYAPSLSEGAARRPEDVRPDDSMTWQFYGGTLDPARRTRENLIFFFAMDARKIRTMMDDGEHFDPTLIAKLIQNKRGCLIGRERLEAMNKRVGERIVVTSMNYVDIDLEFEIVGVCPEGRYNQSAFMNREYLLDALDAYQRQKGVRHALAEKTLNLVWLKVPDTEAFRRISEQIMSSALYTNPAVKVETASSGIAAFLDAYRDLLWGMKYLLVPAILVTMTLVVANAISISVRERRIEMAVLKVLGFGPNQILALILGEALLVGIGSGLASAGATYLFINHVVGGVKFPIAFFPAFYIPINALWWGFAIGAGTALAGSFLPAWSARSVKVAEVFSKVA